MQSCRCQQDGNHRLACHVKSRAMSIIAALLLIHVRTHEVSASAPVGDAAAAPLGCCWGNPVAESGLRSGKLVATALCLPPSAESKACSGHHDLMHRSGKRSDIGMHVTAEAKQAHARSSLRHAQLTLFW